MTTDDMEIVSALQVALADKVGKERYELWFGANARIALVDDALRISVPSPFYQDWLRTNFRRQIEDSCLETIGKELPVSFHVDEALARPRPGAGATTSATLPGNATSPGAAVTPPVSLEPCGRRRFAALDTFVTGTGNRLAEVAARDTVERLGRVSPLLIHGPSGVGKTHLLEGIWSAARRRHPRLHAVYLSAEQFTSYFLEALHGSGLPNFRSKYRGVELLLVDDVQFFAGKRATLVELLHTIDTLVREGRQVVVTADRPVAELDGLGQELTTRLAAGLACGVELPDFDTRRAILRQRAAGLGLPLADEVVEFVAASFRTGARELIGALHRLHVTSRARGQAVSLRMAQEALSDTARAASRAIKLADIQRAVCDAFGLEPQALQSDRKTAHVSHPRMLAMWLARKHTRAALAEIGQFFGKRSHTTVISAQKKVDGWMQSAKPLRLDNRTWTPADAIRRVEENLLAG